MSHPRTPDRTRRWVPWVGQATTADKLLMGAILAVIALGVALQPAKPFLIASHPVLLEFLTGDLVVIGAAAAFARVGEEPLSLVVLAGAVGMVKFDVLTWWAGRRWGEGMIRVLSNSRQAQRWTRRLDRTRPWILRAAVVLAMAPGVPTAVVFAAAGWARMRLTTVSLALSPWRSPPSNACSTRSGGKHKMRTPSLADPQHAGSVRPDFSSSTSACSA